MSFHTYTHAFLKRPSSTIVAFPIVERRTIYNENIFGYTSLHFYISPLTYRPFQTHPIQAHDTTPHDMTHERFCVP